MKGEKRLPYILAGILSAALIMAVRGIFTADTAVQRLLCVCDGFSVSGLLLLCTAAMMWIAGKGSFDMLGYAFRKGLHHLIPGKFSEDGETFYDYKSKRQEEKRSPILKGILMTGIVNIAAGLMLTAVWYGLQPAADLVLFVDLINS